MRTITLEEHFATPGFFNIAGRELTHRAETVCGHYVNLIERLGGETFAYVALKGFEAPPVIVRLDGEVELRVHDEVHLAIDGQRAHLFGADGLALGHAPDAKVAS